MHQNLFGYLHNRFADVNKFLDICSLSVLVCKYTGFIFLIKIFLELNFSQWLHRALLEV